MRINKKWSILIWSVFLSLILVTSFTVISTIVNKNTMHNYLVWNNIKKKLDIDLNNANNSSNSNNNNLSFTNFKEEKIINCTWTWKINIKKWWPIYVVNTTTFDDNLILISGELPTNSKLINFWLNTTYEINWNCY